MRGHISIQSATEHPGDHQKQITTAAPSAERSFVLTTAHARENKDHMAAVAAGIEAMHKEEAGRRLGMTKHRKFPRCLPMALRFLLIDPKA